MMVAARICHDLVSPMGAISNGLELLGMAQDGTVPELELMAQSIQSATTRLRFFRIAFGPVSADQKMARAEILSVLQALEQVNRHSYTWQSTRDLSRRDIKLVFLLIMCLETALPWGGEIRVMDSPDGVELLGLSERIRIDDELWTALAAGTEADTMSSARVQFALAGCETSARNARIALAESPGALRVALRL